MPWRRRSCGRGDAADRAIMMLTTRVATVEPVGWSRQFVGRVFLKFLHSGGALPGHSHRGAHGADTSARG